MFEAVYPTHVRQVDGRPKRAFSLRLKEQVLDTRRLQRLLNWSGHSEVSTYSSMHAAFKVETPETSKVPRHISLETSSRSFLA